MAAELGGRWTDATTGQEVPSAEPLGSADVPSYLRDTEDSRLATVGDAHSDLDVELPADAPTVRFVKGQSSIRVTADAAVAYVERADGHVERWARLLDTTGGCA